MTRDEVRQAIEAATAPLVAKVEAQAVVNADLVRRVEALERERFTLPRDGDDDR